MRIIIAAVAANRAIGWHGQLLYHYREDMERFRRLTMGHPIIMGRATYESLPAGALPGRRNIVLSRSISHIDGCEVCPSLSEALAMCGEGYIYIIGGESVYRESMPIADRLCLTEIKKAPAEADAFFPDYSDWTLLRRESHADFDFSDYVRG